MGPVAIWAYGPIGLYGLHRALGGPIGLHRAPGPRLRPNCSNLCDPPQNAQRAVTRLFAGPRPRRTKHSKWFQSMLKG